MTAADIFEQLKSCKEISSLPQIMVEVIRLSDKDNFTSTELANVISRDVGLASRILQLANSPFYGSFHRVSSINQAVILLGSEVVKAIALSSNIYQLFDSSRCVDPVSFWKHSLETAIASREIARACGYPSVEEAFVTGLMHDVGILILESNFPNQFSQSWDPEKLCDSQIIWEISTFGVDHSQIGKYLADRWHLPSPMGCAITMHHHEFPDRPTSESLPESERLGWIINLANRLSKFQIFQSDPTDRNDLDQIERITEWLGIQKFQLNEIRMNTMNLLIKESEILQIRIGSVTELLESANKLILKQFLITEQLLLENKRMQEEITKEQIKKAAIESLKTITATISHYINNASATILSRAQTVKWSISKGSSTDFPDDLTMNSMESIITSVQTISLVLEELKKMSGFETIRYLNDTSILDLETRLKEHVERLNSNIPPRT